MRSTEPRTGGFTLIEMTLVIGLVAVVATLAVTAGGRFLAKGRLVAAAREMETIRAAFDGPDGYLADLGGLPGFSPALVRTGNLLVATNVFGTVVNAAPVKGAETRAVRLDAANEDPSYVAGAGCASAGAFVRWNAATQRGWRGPYLRAAGLRVAPFPAADDRRFAADATFAERGFFPRVAGLRLPAAWRDSREWSPYGHVGEPVLLDPWGNPYVIQVPPPQAYTNVTTVTEAERFRSARVVSAGPDGILETPCLYPNAGTNWYGTVWSPENRRRVRHPEPADRGDDLVLFFRTF